MNIYIRWSISYFSLVNLFTTINKLKKILFMSLCTLINDFFFFVSFGGLPTFRKFLDASAIKTLFQEWVYLDFC